MPRGDSFVFGMAVADKDLFTTLLENILNKNLPEAVYPKYEVINAGVPAYGTGQELLMMKYLANHSIVGDIYLQTRGS